MTDRQETAKAVETTRTLTPKQERFAQVYIETGNASEAYRQAYDAENMAAKTIWEAASRTLADSKVAARVMELQEKHAKQHEVTVESLAKEYEEARSLGLMEKQPSAMVSATTGKAKLYGLVVDKTDNKTTHGLSAEVAEMMRLADGKTRGLPGKG